MPRKKNTTKSYEIPKATTPEGREQQLINLAIDLAEKQLKEGTASPSVITHYLKLGSTREALEKEMIAEKTKLVNAQVESLESTKRIEDLYAQALKAMQIYSGTEEDDEDIY